MAFKKSRKPISTMTSSFERKQKGLTQLENGESVSHDEVVARIERIFKL